MEEIRNLEEYYKVTELSFTFGRANQQLLLLDTANYNDSEKEALSKYLSEFSAQLQRFTAERLFSK